MVFVAKSLQYQLFALYLHYQQRIKQQQKIINYVSTKKNIKRKLSEQSK